MVSGPFKEIRFPASERFRGPRGFPGDPFDVDVVGPASGRAATSGDPDVTSYLEEDTGLLFIKRPNGTYPDDGIPFRGPDGRSAYEVWLDQGNEGTEAQFFVEIGGDKGDDGDPGPSAFQVWLAQPGNAGLTEQDFFEQLRGPDGASAYQVWLAAGNAGSVEEFLASIRGEEGASAYQVWEAIPENNGKTEAEFVAELGGISGASAFQVWLEQPGNEDGTVEEFLESLRGVGEPGPSAYQEWAGLPGNEGKTFGDFLEAIGGPVGADGLSYSPDASGTLAERSAFDDAAPPFVYLVLDEGSPEHDTLSYRLEATGEWSAPYPRAAPGDPGPSAYEVWEALPENSGKTEAQFLDSLKGRPGDPGPPGKTLYSGVGPPAPALGSAGDSYWEKDAVGNFVALYGPKTAAGWGVAFVPKPKPKTKRAFFPFGGTGNGAGLLPRTDLTDFHVRLPLRLGVRTKRWRLRAIRNYNTKDEVAQAGAIQVTGAWFGSHALNTDGTPTGSFTEAPHRFLQSGVMPADGSEFSMNTWVEDAAQQFDPNQDRLISLGFTCSANQQIFVAGNRCYVHQAAGSNALAGQIANPQASLANNQPFSILLEYEFEGDGKVALLISDSIGAGVGTREGLRTSYGQLWALQNGGACVSAGIGGSTALDWTEVTAATPPRYKWGRFDSALASNNPWRPDFIVIALGRNDLSAGRSEAAIITSLRNVIRVARNNHGAVPIFLAKILPSSFAPGSAQETTRNGVNAWMGRLEEGVAGALYFESELRSPSDITVMALEFRGGDAGDDTTHPGTAGHAKLAQYMGHLR